MMEKICLNCGMTFQKKVSDSKKYFQSRLFCSNKCYGKKGFSVAHKEKLRLCKIGKPLIRSEEGKRSFSEKMSGEKHHKWKGGNIKKICEECGNNFEVDRNRENTAKYCSPICRTNSLNQGLSTENEKLRRGKKFRIWRELVFERDDWTCQKCLERGSNLNAHHIYNFSTNEELRFDIDNGITFCRECHYDFHSTFGFNNNSKEQIVGFLNNF